MGKLRSLEMVRAVAAGLVVLFHTTVIFGQRSGVIPFGGLFGAGSRGVDLFFVLSGFIIAHVHSGDIGRPRRLGNYLFNRGARIYPAVWIMTVFAGALYASGFGGAGKAGKLTWYGGAASLLLLPQHGDALVNVTWTLKYEIFFYLVFAVMIVDRWSGFAVLLLWQLAVAVASLWFADSEASPAGFYLRSLCLEFSIGLVCAWLVSRPGFSARMAGVFLQWALLGAGIVVFVVGMGLEGRWGAAGVLCALGAAAVIVGLILLEQSGRIRVPNLLVTLGGASYAIYLVHFSVITLLAVAVMHVPALPKDDVVFLAVAVCGVCAGVIFDRAIDRPAQRLLRLRVKPLFVGRAG